MEKWFAPRIVAVLSLSLAPVVGEYSLRGIVSEPASFEQPQAVLKRRERIPGAPEDVSDDLDPGIKPNRAMCRAHKPKTYSTRLG